MIRRLRVRRFRWWHGRPAHVAGRGAGGPMLCYRDEVAGYETTGRLHTLPGWRCGCGKQIRSR